MVLVGGIGYKIIAPSSKTVIAAGGRQVIVNTDGQDIPIGGCTIWRLNGKLSWKRQFNLSDGKKANDEKIKNSIVHFNPIK